MISVDEALAVLARHRLDLPTDRVGLDRALNRELAEDVSARVTLPPHAGSAMDGYAVRFADLAGQGTRLQVIGEAPAGTPFPGSAGPGEAVRIFTGSVVPQGADHIVIQEDVTREGDQILLDQTQASRAHIRAAGGDFSAGDVLLRAGMRLGPAQIAVAAAADHAAVPVRRRTRVAILANGDELRAPGSDPGGGEIIASNYYGLAALLRKWGAEPIDLGIARDSPEDIAEHIERASDADIIVPIGGASVGDHDHMFAAFTDAGFAPIFRKIAVKPGKPTWFAAKGSQLVLGLPGNPASAFVCAQLFLRALLSGAERLAEQPAVLTDSLRANGPRENFLRARLSVGTDGTRQVSALDRQDSSLISPFLDADCLIRRLPASASAQAGEVIRTVWLER